jgi:hypothetical protein
VLLLRFLPQPLQLLELSHGAKKIVTKK